MTYTAFDPALLITPATADYRLHSLKALLNDKDCDAGPFPNGSNFEDEEINNFLYLSSNSINGAFIRACKQLASAWTSYALVERNETGWFDAKDVAKQWKERADEAVKSPVDGQGQPHLFHGV